jgi:hypothetical protein
MMDWILLAVLSLFCVCSLVITALQLPGNWILLFCAVAFDAYYHWQRFGWKWLVALGVLAAAGEAIELAASAVVARRAGASRRAGLGALVGGIAGMILLSIPVPIVGTIIGGVIGCFAGAVVMELTLHDDLAKSARVGVFASIGRILGLVAKLSCGMAMAGAAVALAVSAVWRAT